MSIYKYFPLDFPLNHFILLTQFFYFFFLLTLIKHEYVQKQKKKVKKEVAKRKTTGDKLDEERLSFLQGLQDSKICPYKGSEIRFINILKVHKEDSSSLTKILVQWLNGISL